MYDYPTAEFFSCPTAHGWMCWSLLLQINSTWRCAQGGNCASEKHNIIPVPGLTQEGKEIMCWSWHKLSITMVLLHWSLWVCWFCPSLSSFPMARNSSYKAPILYTVAHAPDVKWSHRPMSMYARWRMNILWIFLWFISKCLQHNTWKIKIYPRTVFFTHKQFGLWENDERETKHIYQMWVVLLSGLLEGFQLL